MTKTELIEQRRPGLERALRLVAYEKAKPLVPAASAILEQLERSLRYELDHGPLTSTFTD